MPSGNLDQVCTAEEECVRPGKCENTAVVDARAEATLMDCAQFMNRRPDANFFSYDVDTQVSKTHFRLQTLSALGNHTPNEFSMYIHTCSRSVS